MIALMRLFWVNSWAFPEEVDFLWVRVITSKYCICKRLGLLPAITVTDRSPWKANSGLSLLFCSNFRLGVGQGDCIQFWKVPGRIFTPFLPLSCYL